MPKYHVYLSEAAQEILGDHRVAEYWFSEVVEVEHGHDPRVEARSSFNIIYDTGVDEWAFDPELEWFDCVLV